MKKYTNKCNEMRTVFYSDGSAQFLMRGQSVETEKEVKKVQNGIVVTEVTGKTSSKTRQKKDEQVTE